MEESGKVGTVKMKAFYALKGICENYPTGTLIGGILARYEDLVNKRQKEKQENQTIEIKETSMFGYEVLEQLGIVAHVNEQENNEN